jgi:gamma-carbonic anhydrase
MTFRGHKPFVTNDTFVAPTASVIGNVTCWDQSSIWYKAVVRADNPGASITIGFSSSIGEGSVVTTLPPGYLLRTEFPPDCVVGHYVRVGAGCILKSCRIDDLCTIRDKCTILEGSYIESNVILEAGTTVLPYQRIPAGQRWGGNPAQFISNVTYEEMDAFKNKALHVHEMAKDHIVEFLPHGFSYIHLEELEKEAAAAAAK